MEDTLDSAKRKKQSKELRYEKKCCERVGEIFQNVTWSS